MSRDIDAVWDALMTGQNLIDDLIGLEAAGIETGFKSSAIKKMKQENALAFAALANLGKVTA